MRSFFTYPFISLFKRNQQYLKLFSKIHEKPLVVFIKGSPAKPKSRRSKKLIRILNGYDYSSFDILTDKPLFEWLKVYSGSSAYPQIFLHNEYKGSLEEIVELTKSGELFNLIGQDLNTRLQKILSSNKHIVAMMGSKEEPICGFSKRLIELLAEYNLDYETFDISIDSQVCEGLKTFSNWPTYPQVYTNGELIGGLDICMQLHSEGSLKQALNI